MKVLLNRFFTAFVVILFAGFCIIWLYDAITVPHDDSVSMFYSYESKYYTQVLPWYVGILLPILLIGAVLVLTRIHKARWGLCLGLFLMQIITKIFVGSYVYWLNPFHRNIIAPTNIDYALCGFLYLSIVINIIYFLSLIAQGNSKPKKKAHVLTTTKTTRRR